MTIYINTATDIYKAKLYTYNLAEYTDDDLEDLFWERFDDEDLKLVEGYRQIIEDQFENEISYIPKWAIESIDIRKE